MPGLLDAVPSDQPALEQAQHISVLAARAGFEWPDFEGVWDKLLEELDEYRQARAEQPGGAHAFEELGDVLFCAVQLARWDARSAEEALAQACVKFRSRWAIMEQSAQERWGVDDISQLSSAQLEELWAYAKRSLRKEQE